MRDAKRGGALIYGLLGLRTNNGINKMERCCVGKEEQRGRRGEDGETGIKNKKI